MANLKEIRTRITSVNSTRQITSAMKMVAAAKLRKAQNAIIQMRPYADKLHNILDDIISSTDISESNIYAQNRKVERVLIVVISSNRGLCGAFNSNAVKKAIELIHHKYGNLYETGNLDVITIGKKAKDIFKAKNINVLESHDDIFDDLNFENSSAIAKSVMGRFTDKTYDEVRLVYNEFKNVAVQLLASDKFLPIEIEKSESKNQHDYIFEPNKIEITDKLVPYALKIRFYKAILESYASEHGARMTAMHMATDNATDMLRELKLKYNKARQASITNEILEIVSGAEALKS
ncbi:MAG: ATP synthase F1 subunit gamma [Bacteroidales bacterium]|nr:ATP synthase F1 subunit gamma [Bacteroidales bacterium]MBN2756685.1 ATP synthase F1 subunit gamma [Bacteroidales bacterium]